MILNRVICLIWVLCTAVIFSSCDRWDDIKNIPRYQKLYEETLSELNRYKNELKGKKKEVDECKENLNRALTKADEYKGNWGKTVTKASQYKENLDHALAKADEYKYKWERMKIEAVKANAEILAFQEGKKELKKRLRAATLENQKAKLMIVGLKQQLEQFYDDVKEML